MPSKSDVKFPEFMSPDEIDEVLFTKEMLAERVLEMGAEISKSYGKLAKPLVVICTLKGAATFFADLVRALECDHMWEFMSFSSYGAGTTSSGAVQMVLDLKMDIEGRDVLIVEDILDTGNTLKYMYKQLHAREPKSVKTAVLLHKHEMTIPGVEADFVGFKIPNKFVVGYGLDYAQKYRGLPWVGVVAPWVYLKAKETGDDKLDTSVAKGMPLPPELASAEAAAR
jgi:hypoxanthine phosphoribosyltransferase